MLRFLFFLLFVGVSTFAQAQILDDSTKLVYGPNTTTYIKEDNILYNDLTFTVIDTSSNNSHRWSKVEKLEYKVQDLGVSGTAIRNIYYTLPQYLIGARSGYSAYVPYYKPIRDFKYYDTKSPYSRIVAAIGSRNRTVVDVGFNRSDSSNFNIGLDYFNYNSDKQVASKGKNDRLVKNEGFDAYLVYFTPKRHYLVMANFSRMKTQAADQGGIKIDTLNPELGYFDRDANVFLQNANSEYLKRTYHLYHQFRANDAFQVYQIFDRSYDQTKFMIDPLAGDINYFDSTYLNTDATNDSTLFETISWENGVKGTIGNLFYSAHYRYRIYSFHYGADTLGFENDKPAQDGIEHYIGGRVRYNFSPDYQLYGGIDFNLNGNQKLWGKVRFKGLEADFVTQQYEASFMEKAYLGNHDYWVNDFKTIKALHVDGGYTHYFKNNSFIKPKATFTTYTDYVYYNKEAVPTQLDGTSTILTVGAKFLINPLNKLYIEGEGLYTTVAGDSTHVFPVPKLMVNLNVYLHGISYGGNLDWQIGIDNHWKSDYFAPDYRVSTNQFFIQDNFNVEAYLISDFYVNVKVGHAFVFFKYNNLLGIINEETYFAAPNYIGKKSLIDYGFYWMFFD